ncbi:siphovirus Gp157 family protein [Salibacterium lacus]|uniref:Siphovirus Gp157 family protein n=1 Tax=Salibacterium lacus TaxID=1898109 RepID=A0ABW5SZ67_9BACI
MKLYELTDSYTQILDMIEEGADRESLKDTLDSIEEAVEEKVDRIGMVMKTLEASEKAIKEEEQRLSQRKKHYQSEREHLKDYLEHQLTTMGKTKVKGTMFTAGIQKNPPSVDVMEEEHIPKKYYIEKPPQLDRKALLDAVKGGEDIKGVAIKQTEGMRLR